MNAPRKHTSSSTSLRAVILGSGRPDILAEAQRICGEISRYVQIVKTDFTGNDDLSAINADLAIVLGGDGSILRAAQANGPSAVACDGR